jgi:hypothetical protein
MTPSCAPVRARPILGVVIFKRRIICDITRDIMLRCDARAQVQPCQCDPSRAPDASHKKATYVAKNVFSRHNSRDKTPHAPRHNVASTRASASPREPMQSGDGRMRNCQKSGIMSPKNAFRDIIPALGAAATSRRYLRKSARSARTCRTPSGPRSSAAHS